MNDLGIEDSKLIESKSIITDYVKNREKSGNDYKWCKRNSW